MIATFKCVHTPIFESNACNANISSNPIRIYFMCFAPDIIPGIQVGRVNDYVEVKGKELSETM